VNSAIDTATTEQCRIRRVHNCINLQLCDVTAEDFDSAIGILHESLNYNDGGRVTINETVGRLCQSRIFRDSHKRPTMESWSDEVLEYCRKEKSLLRHSISPSV
jgi:hypothetical protein